MTIEAEAFDTDSGGTAGTGFDALNHNRYWSAQITGGAANFTSTTVRLTEQGSTGANAIGQSATVGGTYDSIGGVVLPPTIGQSGTITTLGYFAVGRVTGASTISGSFTVGTGGDFTTLTAAVAPLNSRVMTGPVTFQLTDATYPAETFPIIINPNGGNSATNTLTIKPASGVSPVISGSATGGLIVLNGIDYVTIDGSNSGGSTRDTTVTNTGTGTSSAVVWGQTVTTADPTTNNTIKNLNVSGNASTTTFAGIGFGSTTIGTGTLGTRNDNNRVQNNNITQLQFGVVSVGSQSAAKNFGTVVTGNTLGGNGAAALGRAGVWVAFEDGAQVTNNTVVNVTAINSADVFGLAIGTNAITGSAITTQDVANVSVTGNFVGSVVKTDTFSAAGIALGTPNYGTSRIANNSIYGVNANSTPGDLAGRHHRWLGGHDLRADGGLFQLGVDDRRAGRGATLATTRQLRAWRSSGPTRSPTFATTPSTTRRPRRTAAPAARRALRDRPVGDRALQLLHLELQRPLHVRRRRRTSPSVGAIGTNTVAQVAVLRPPDVLLLEGGDRQGRQLDQRRPDVRLGDEPAAAPRLAASRSGPDDRGHHDRHRRRHARQPAVHRRLREPLAAAASGERRLRERRRTDRAPGRERHSVRRQHVCDDPDR